MKKYQLILGTKCLFWIFLCHFYVQKALCLRMQLISVWRLLTLFGVNLLDFGGSCGGCPTSYITRGRGGSQVKIKKRQNEKYV